MCVCIHVGAGRCTCVCTNESGSQRTNSGATQFFFSLLGLDLSLAWNSTGRPSLGLLEPRDLSMSSSPEIRLQECSARPGIFLCGFWGINIPQDQVLERDAGTDSAISTTKLLLSISSEIVLYFWDFFIHIFKL